MDETFEELVTKHTRRELEEMALNLGAENLGGTKSQLAEAILEAIKKQKESPKPAKQEMPKVVQMVDKPKVSTGSTMPHGKNGVMARISAINSKSSEFQTAGRQMREEGIRKMNKGVREFHSATDTMSKNMATDLRNIASDAKAMREDGLQRFNAGQVAFRNDLNFQIKENSEAISKFNSGAREIKSATDQMSKDFQKAGKNIRDEGISNLQNGLRQFRSDVNSQVKSNRDAISKIDASARDLQGRAKALHDEIHRYQEQDLKNYTRDFYYG